MMRLLVQGEVWYWKGPAPFHFVTVPEAEAEVIREIAPRVSYGWGMVPAVIELGETRLKTALWPKDGSYIVPLRDVLRRANGIEVGDRITLTLELPDPFA